MSLARLIAHYIIPRSSNNHRAKVLHFSSVAVLAVAFVIFQFGLEAVSKKTDVLGYAAQISPEEVIRLTNVKRAEHGVPPVTLNPKLSQAAQSKGAHMLLFNYWAHVAPDGTEPWKFFKDANYSYRYAGENLARDFSSPSAAVDAWMASPTHRDNMLSPKYKEIGIGVVEGDLNGADTTIIVQLFGASVADSKPTVDVAPVKAETALARAPIATPIPTPVSILGQAEPKVLVSPFVTTKGVSLAVVGILVLALVIDLVIVSRRRIRRISGRSLAHISFLSMLLIIVLILRAGKII